MRKPLSALRLVLSAICALTLFGLPAHGQDKDKDEAIDHPNGIVQDWSRRQVVYPRFGPIEGLIGAQHDPRAILSWQEEWRKDWHRANHWRHPHAAAEPGLHRDWSISLGAGTTAAGMFPAKYGLDTHAVPTCGDFAVFPVAATGGAAQPNIVAFSNLYSGGSKVITGSTNSTTTVTITTGTVTAADVGQAISGTGIPGGDTIASVTGGPPATSLTLAVAATATNAGVAITVGTGAAGFCNGRAPQGTVDNLLQATTMWSYDINGAGGQVVTSPSVSVDGNKIAFIETAAGAAHFHVLAWKSGDGVNTNAQNVLVPKAISSGFATLAPAAGSGTVTDLALGSSSDTLSSPFVEFNQDVAYVGNDSGTLFRIKNVFCTISCTVGVTAAPSLDLSWPTSGGSANTGTLSVCAGALTGPVQGPAGNIYVGCSDGKLYGVSPTGTVFGSVTVGGSALTDGGIVDPPLVDVVNGLIYAVSGNSSGGTSVLVQTNTNFSSTVTAALGSAGKFNLHSPAFNEDYFSCTPQGVGCTWMIYALALDATDTHSSLWGVGFTGSHLMNAVATIDAFGIGPFEFSPATTFFDGVQTRLFESVLTNSIGGNLVSLNVSNGTAFPPALDSFATEGSGTSGIVVDNDSSGTAQEDNIYFGALVANTAVKLTQTGLL